MRIVLACVAVLAFARVADATVVVPAEFREIVSGSELIVVGRVVDVRAEWTEDRRRIESYVTVEVDSTLKGRTEETVTFRVPGGEMGRYRSITVGAPVFARDDEVVLCLNARGGVPYVFGFNQGVFRVRVDARTGQRTVDIPGLLARRDTPEVIRRGAITRRPVPLEGFNAQVRAIVAEIGASGAPR